MIIVCECEIQPRALEPPVELVIASVKVVKLNALSKQLPLDVISQWNGIIPCLVLQLIDIVISDILIGGARDCVMVLHETKQA